MRKQSIKDYIVNTKIKKIIMYLLKNTMTELNTHTFYV